MAVKRDKPELLAPAGDMERLKMAVLYGADAVYLAGTSYGMRAFAGNFSDEELPQAVAVIFGANIGTTVTAQLLAFRLEDARYLLLVAGLLLWFAGRGRLHAAGQALFAFGLLFEGIAVMAEAMEPLAAGPVFRQWMARVRHRPGLGLLAGLFIVIRGIERVGIIDELSRAISRMGGGTTNGFTSSCWLPCSVQ